MLDFLEHPIASYWRKATVRSWADAWLFMRKHVYWEVGILGGAVVILLVLRIAELWHEVILGLVLMGSAALLIWLWHLFIVTPASIHREDKLALEEARADIAQQQEARAKAETEVANLRILLAESQGKEDAARVLQVEGFIDDLSYACSAEWRQANEKAFFAAALMARAYACLRVRNTGSVNLYKLVAHCFAADGAEIPCFWSREPGKKFVLGSSDTPEDLPVEHDRLLVVAKGFGREQVWTPLQRGQENFFGSDLPTGQGNGSDVSKILKRHADPVIELQPGSDGLILLSVRFRAEGLEQENRLYLGFDPALIADAGLVIKLEPSLADPAPSKASEQSPPSSPESSGSPSASK